MRSIVGRGGMGVVYKVDHAILRQPLAVKVLRIDQSMGEQAIARFEQEAQAASLLRHTNLVHVTDYGVTKSGAPYLVMDYFDGLSISDMLLKHGPFSLEQALPMFIQICTGVAYVHTKGIVHRDIKPSNIMLTHDERNNPVAKILDFGLAKFLPEVNSGYTTLTQTGEVFGSPLYMSPEQCRGESVDERSDVYSVACVMYEMITGIPPFKADTAVLTIYKHVNEEAVPPSQVSASIPESISRIIMRALSKNLEIRYSSIEELKDDLTRVAAGEEPEDLPIPDSVVQAEHKRNMMKSIGVTLAGLVVVIGIVLGIKAFKPPESAWEATMTQARNQIQQGDLSMAVLSYKNALSQSSSAKPSEQAKIKIALADLYKHMSGDKNREQIREAIKNYTDALAMIDPEDHSTIAHTNEGVADCLHLLKDYDEAQLYFSNAVDYREKTEATDPYALGAVLMKQGRNFKDNNKFDQAETSLKRAIEIVEKLSFVQQVYVPQCLIGLSQMASKNHQNDRARLFKEAADIQKGISGQNDANFARQIEKRNKLLDEAFASSK
ncbi:MAG TPA: serine/threonine-protein kinase [Drouetiella sp.]